MLKTKKIICKLLVLAMMMVSVVSVNTNEVSAATNSVEFINVAQYNGGSEGQKGDAALITYNNNYYLVDTGVGASYTPGTTLYNRLRGLGKKLSGVIITHGHNDHMGALSAIVNDSTVFNKNKTVVYCNNAHLNGITNILSGVKNVVKVKKGQIYNIANGSNVSLAYAQSYNGLYVYGSTLSKSNVVSKRNENNASMVVQLKGGAFNALLLGDLLAGSASGGGVLGVDSYYGSAIYGVHYTVCKLGHHGLRNSDYSTSQIQKEFTNFYNKLSVGSYVFTTTNATLQAPNFWSNYCYMYWNTLPNHQGRMYLYGTFY